jgi:hypothetical protein
MKINTLRVITILNEKDYQLSMIENYNKRTVVKDIEATVYDALVKK